MNVLALDLATKTGWACIVEGCFESGVMDFGFRKKKEKGDILLQFRKWLHGFHAENDLGRIVCERSHFRGWDATLLCVGLLTEVMAFCFQMNIAYSDVHTGTLKKWSCGNGKATKLDMMKAACMKGWNPIDDNEADACMLLEYAIEEK